MTIKKWYSARELVGIEGMPKTMSSVSRKASIDNWEKRKIDGVKGISYEYHIDSLPEKTRQHLLGVALQNIHQPDDHMAEIPFYEIHASAGHGSVPIEGEYSPYTIEIHQQLLHDQGIRTRNLFIVPVKGDSMEPSLYDGDLAILKRVTKPLLVLEGVYLIRIGSELFIKRIQYNKFEGYLQVGSDNDYYRSYTITGEDLNHVEIYGEWMLTLSRARKVSLSKPTTKTNSSISKDGEL